MVTGGSQLLTLPTLSDLNTTEHTTHPTQYRRRKTPTTRNTQQRSKHAPRMKRNEQQSKFQRDGNGWTDACNGVNLWIYLDGVTALRTRVCIYIYLCTRAYIYIYIYLSASGGGTTNWLLGSRVARLMDEAFFLIFLTGGNGWWVGGFMIWGFYGGWVYGLVALVVAEYDHGLVYAWVLLAAW